MPSLEAFTEPEPKRQEGGYACMSLGGQGCFYTAQGEFVCGDKKVEDQPTPCTQGPTLNFAERFAQAPAVERFTQRPDLMRK